MKLSSRKKLLKESDIILKEIRIKISEDKLNEENLISEFFSNLVKSIVSGIVRKWKNARQTYYHTELPYLVGLDLINNRNIKIDRRKLRGLEKLIKNIINDVKTSPQLQLGIDDLKKAEKEVTLSRGIVQSFSDKEKIEKPNSFKKWESEWRRNIDKYYDLISNNITPIISDILKTDKYKNFEEMIIQELGRGIKGLTPTELEQVKNNYIRTVSKRVADYVDKYEVGHTKTAYEVPRFDQDIEIGVG